MSKGGSVREKAVRAFLYDNTSSIVRATEPEAKERGTECARWVRRWQEGKLWYLCIKSTGLGCHLRR